MELARINQTALPGAGVFVSITDDTSEHLVSVVARSFASRRFVVETNPHASEQLVHLLVMALADQLFCIGSGSLPHNAASLSGKVCGGM